MVGDIFTVYPAELTPIVLTLKYVPDRAIGVTTEVVVGRSFHES
jgi:hypothetical protein